MSKTNSPEKVFDLRTIEYLLLKGELTQKDYDKYLKSLPDDEGNYAFIEVEGSQEEETPAS